MIKILQWVITVLILLLGAVHTAIGFYCKHLDEDTLWFIGSGIAIIFAGMFNLLFIVVPAKQVRTMTLIVNAIVLALFILALQVLTGVQVYIGVMLFLSAAVFTVVHRSAD